jgi:hypothetical protein
MAFLSSHHFLWYGIEFAFISKSPGRKIRTPGFEGGLSGIWQYYRAAGWHAEGKKNERSDDCFQSNPIHQFLHLSGKKVGLA